jgi:hypothetical protein
MNKITLGVLFGGVSSEHDISTVSAKGILSAIDKEKYNLVLLGITKEGRWFLFDDDIDLLPEVKSVANEISEEVRSLFAKKKKADLDKIKMPKAVSRSKAKNGVVSYDVDSLANRFGVLYPDMKDEIKRNIATYGEFLPETFFTEYGTPRVLEVMRSGREADIKKLFKALGEIYEDGTNEVQDIIGVTILGEMKNDPQLMEIADRYMTEYMAGPVHEINKLTAKNNRWTKKLKNPPPYKPKKQNNMLQNALNQQQK